MVYTTHAIHNICEYILHIKYMWIYYIYNIRDKYIISACGLDNRGSEWSSHLSQIVEWKSSRLGLNPGLQTPDSRLFSQNVLREGGEKARPSCQKPLRCRVRAVRLPAGPEGLSYLHSL